MPARPGNRRSAPARLLRNERGQASFEFLLILPVFFIFLLLVVDFGLMMYQYVTVANGAREGARYGAVSCYGGTCTAAAITDVVQQGSGAFVGDSDVTVVRHTGSSGAMVAGESVIVRIDHQYNFLFIPFASIKVVSCADMRLESATNAPTGLGTGTHCDGS